MEERIILSRETLDQETQECFDIILGKAITDLTGEEIDFLRARKAYLTDEEINKYAEVIFRPEKEVEVIDTPKKKRKKLINNL